MKKSWLSLIFLTAGLGLAAMVLAQPVSHYAGLEKVMGAEGQVQEGAWVVRFPRSDLKVSINGEPMPTALGFVSWLAFQEMGREGMVMGDLVLTEPEVNPVISALEKAGIQVTALHNHFFWEQPRLMYMHVHGVGAMQTLAQGLRAALDSTSTPKTRATAAGPPAPALNTKRLEEIIGHAGQAGGGAFKITVGRQGVTQNGMGLTSTLGLNSWAGFVGTDAKAHVAGDIVMAAKEVNPVIAVLRQGGIDVVAVHNHMLNEQPRVFFLHYWGTGQAEKLAQTVRRAFDLVKGPIR